MTGIGVRRGWSLFLDKLRIDFVSTINYQENPFYLLRIRWWFSQHLPLPSHAVKVCKFKKLKIKASKIKSFCHGLLLFPFPFQSIYNFKHLSLLKQIWCLRKFHFIQKVLRDFAAQWKCPQQSSVTRSANNPLQKQKQSDRAATNQTAIFYIFNSLGSFFFYWRYIKKPENSIHIVCASLNNEYKKKTGKCFF